MCHTPGARGVLKTVMAEEQDERSLVKAARTIGSAVGKVVSAAGAATTSVPEAPAKDKVWQAEYVGSGTFIIHKPKRKAGKRHQSVVRNRRAGMR